jgi:hypothetical protein
MKNSNLMVIENYLFEDAQEVKETEKLATLADSNEGNVTGAKGKYS